jgi:chaperonin GroEL
MSRQITFDTPAREKLKAGIDALADAVKVTLGPKGRNVVIYKKYGAPHVTKDGVTVAKSIQLSDPIEDMGAQMLKEVASKTADIAGDGTTTATVLAQAMVTAGLKNVASGANPIDLKRGIDKAVSVVVSELAKISEGVGSDYEKIKQVATVSANNDEAIGSLIADAMQKVGTEGVITVEEANGTETEVKVVEGMQIDRGYISPYFMTDGSNQEAVLDNPLILIYNKTISNIKELLPTLEQSAQTGRPLLIIAEDVDGEALAALVVNKMNGRLKVAAIKAPSFGDTRKDVLHDIAILTGAEVVGEETGLKLESVTLMDLGGAEKIIVRKESTTIIGGLGDKDEIGIRTAEIKNQIEKASTDREKNSLQFRLAKLSGGVAVLYVGASTEVEMKEKRDRVDDALSATRAAVEEGIVTGGGVAYIRLALALDGVLGSNADECTGMGIVLRALEEPLRRIVSNAGGEGAVVVQRVRESSGSFGYNARTDKYEDLHKAGVIDPAKVTRVALENAASVAGMILITECVVSNTAEDKQ